MNEPKLRFKSDDGNQFPDWKECNFGDLYKVYSGFAFKYKSYCESGVALINGQSIQHGYIENSNMNYLPEAFLQQYKDFVLKENDIVLGLNRPITNGKLKIARIPKEYNNSLLYQRAGKIEYKKAVNDEFSYVLLNREIFKFTVKEAAGSDQPFISTSKLNDWKIQVPSLPEQQKIASLFTEVDTLIQSAENELEGYRELKQGMLQKMFPKKGEKVPDVRFPEFSGDWEQRKLGDVVQITMGQSPDGSTYSDEPSDYILVQGNADLQNGWVCPRVWTTQITKKADAGDLIMSVRAPAGAMGKTAYNAVIGRGVAAIKGNEFIYQLLIKMDKEGYWKKDSTGSTFESLNSSSIKNAEIKLPTLEEQNKIGEYFQNLDSLIASQQQELDGYKELKKGLLQQMFC